MKKEKGILLHISSLSGKYGIGTLGKTAYEFIDFLKASGMNYWQVLPICQTGAGNSPYSSCCSYSGNPYFIDFDILILKKLIKKVDLKGLNFGKTEKIDYQKIEDTHIKVLRKAYKNFDNKDKKFINFLKKGRFNDYALYMTIKSKYNNCAFYEFPLPLKERNLFALKNFKKENLYEYLFWQFVQFEFFCEWNDLKTYANKNGIKIIGDIPIYVALDSVEVWSNKKLFVLDKDFCPTFVSGVPPDCFSKDGQLWGNPVYNFYEQEKDNYKWWKNRVLELLKLFNAVRIDHFRAFDRFYIIKNGEATAKNGVWIKAPGREIFEGLKKIKHRLNIIAEDLGTIDNGVKELLSFTGFPGMKVLLFAFDGNKDNFYLPKNIEQNSICYTGTHDNDTVLGYIEKLNLNEKNALKKQIQSQLAFLNVKISLKSNKNIAYAFLIMAIKCNSKIAIFPMQDILFLNNNFRMNIPSTTCGNWSYRLKKTPGEKTIEFIKTLK